MALRGRFKIFSFLCLFFHLCLIFCSELNEANKEAEWNQTTNMTINMKIETTNSSTENLTTLPLLDFDFDFDFMSDITNMTLLKERLKRSELDKEPYKLNFANGQTASILFDLCSVIKCGADHSVYHSSKVYVCTTNIMPYPNRDFGCGYQTGDWGKIPFENRLDIKRGTFKGGQCKNDFTCNPMLLTMINPQVTDIGVLLLGIFAYGQDPVGTIYIHVIQPSDLELHIDVSPEEEMTDDTGFMQVNYWMKYVRDAAKQAKFADCVVCAQARPALLTVPSPLNNDSSFFCMFELHITENPSVRCKYLEKVFPISPKTDTPPKFNPIRNSYTCLARRGQQRKRRIGQLDLSWCGKLINVTFWSNATKLTVSRADVFWYCGGNKLLNSLPSEWDGVCTQVTLVSPVRSFNVTIEEMTAHQVNLEMHVDGVGRFKREFDIYANSPAYIDAIGVPRGVPTEFKLVDQVAAGFESILPWVTLNKNVDRLNFVHFNIQRLNNLTRDALQSAHEQLAATSLMAYQNRIALDYLLAEQSGVCSFFGASCCTYIPGNTGADGSFTKAVKGLRALSEEMVSHSGVSDKIEGWFAKTFGGWKAMLSAVLMPAVTVIIIIACCCGCGIPIARLICLKTISQAIRTNTDHPVGAYQMRQQEESAQQPLHYPYGDDSV